MGTNYGRVTSRMNFKMRALSVSSQTPNTTSCRFRLYEMSKKGKSMRTENRCMAARGWGGGRVTARGGQVIIEGMETC